MLSTDRFFRCALFSRTRIPQSLFQIIFSNFFSHPMNSHHSRNLIDIKSLNQLDALKAPLDILSVQRLVVRRRPSGAPLTASRYHALMYFVDKSSFSTDNLHYLDFAYLKRLFPEKLKKYLPYGTYPAIEWRTQLSYCFAHLNHLPVETEMP